MENRMAYRWILRLGVLLVTLVFLAGWAREVSAAPAAPIDIEITQPDGSTFTGRQWGDEWQNGYETDAGYTILRETDGWWVYAAAAKDGTLAPQLLGNQERLLVGKSSPDGLKPHLRPAEKSVPQNAFSGELSPNAGSQATLVLLAEFNDWPHTYEPSHFASTIFGASASVKDFYLKASFNQLTLSPAAETQGTVNDGIVGWLNVGLSHPNTGGTVDNRNQNIVKNALIAADPYINFASFDTNGNGYISNTELHIVVVVAGYEASLTGSPSPKVWGHRWNLNDIGGVQLENKWLGVAPYGGYAQFGEIHIDHPVTMGIIAHELGHDLTWPDLYDTDYSSEGVGDWSIMGGGSWNKTPGGYAGNSPAFPDAFLKWYQGWITPIPVSGVQPGLVINQAATNPQAYILGTNPGGINWNFDVTSGTGEYFLVENRQLTSYDIGLPGCGLIITHIDESVRYQKDINFDINSDENHPLVKVIEADGFNHLKDAVNRGDAGDPFPGSSNKQLFDYSSNPNSRLYNNSDSQVAVSMISPCSSAMTATLAYGSVPMNNKVFLPLIKNGNPPPPGIDPIRNGSFEAGHDVNWLESSSGNYHLIVNSFPNGIVAHGGTWGTWLGGYEYAVDSITQTAIQVGSLRYLHYWYWIRSGDWCGYDFAKILVNGAEQASINLCTGSSTTGWAHGLLDLNAFLGTTISVEFRVTNDFDYHSHFCLDDVSISAASTFAPYEGEPLLNEMEVEPRKYLED
ncbi:MAG TPA: M6 family metalloprotease domain-containing protein [Bellilinea sp.]|nr:M6 family metalloprotease domain-containing protein [Bellilinea sp.]